MQICLQREQEKTWINFLNSISTKTKLDEFFKKIKRFQGKYTPTPTITLQNQDGELTNEAEEVSDIFARHFASIAENQQTNSQSWAALL